MPLFERLRRPAERKIPSDEYEQLWQVGSIFHEFDRHAVGRRRKKVDRLAEILASGIIPPSMDTSGKVVLNWEYVRDFHNIPPRYNSVVFMRRLTSQTSLYKPWMGESRGIYLFLQNDVHVLTESDMGGDWPLLNLYDEEVYSDKVVAPEKFRSLVVPVEEAPTIAESFASRLNALNISLFDFGGFKLNLG